jgi:hypothetical protein
MLRNISHTKYVHKNVRNETNRKFYTVLPVFMPLYGIEDVVRKNKNVIKIKLVHKTRFKNI